ncbi:MAG: 3-methyl-2-oxobutanoate hydroxymethyltransferase [Spirochaetia bacterium]|nr:3-methyl-2-oxobutanoate hydroxymethyltransferase [Spirochaetia bacterium]
MKFTHQYIIVLGANLGDKKKNISEAIRLLQNERITLLKESEFLYTEAAIVKDQPDFINKGIFINTDFSPEELLNISKQVEQTLKRSTTYRFGPREIDIDIVWWSTGEYRSERLQIPHAGNNSRSWVIEILAQLIPFDSPQSSYYTSMNVKPIKTILDFIPRKIEKQKIVFLTAYDYSMAKILSRTSVDVLLVGDSLGNVIQGNGSTIGVTVDQMIYHGKAVKKAAPDKFIIIDMPFLSYQINSDEAVRNAGRIIQETGANALKLEGGVEFSDVYKKIIRAGIPVMGHLGLMPQSTLKTGGNKLQAKDDASQKKLFEEAKALQDLGVFALLAELIPAELGAKLSKALEIPVIGIGAGPEVDGQVLVINDLLGFDAEFSPKFLRKYMDMHTEAVNAIENYSKDVRSQNYPSKNESFFIDEK